MINPSDAYGDGWSPYGGIGDNSFWSSRLFEGDGRGVSIEIGLYEGDGYGIDAYSGSDGDAVSLEDGW